MIIFTYGAWGFTTFFGVSYPRLSQWFSQNCTTLELDNWCTFRILGGWQAVSLRGGMTVTEQREILAGWVTKVCLKCTEKLG